MPSFNKNDFSGNPVRLDAARSRFNLNFKHKTTFNAGLLIPIFSYGDVLPGDTFSVDLSSLVRMTTPVFPVMDDAYMDVYFFFTPHKEVLSRQSMSPSVNDSIHSWNAFIGAQDSLLNMPLPSDVLLPYVYLGADSGGDPKLGSLTDYLGLPLSGGLHGINVLEPLAYYAVWNNYFRDENTMQPVVYSFLNVSSSTNPDLDGRARISFSGFDGTSRWGASGDRIGNVGSILPVCRPHGYFGSALPWPQRNSETIQLPLLGTAPVYAMNGGSIFDQFGTDVIPGTMEMYTSSASDSGWTEPSGTGQNLQLDDRKVMTGTGTGSSGNLYTTPSNLYAALDYAEGISVNQLRLLVQEQRFYEALARGGNRIGEMTATMFGVTPSDFAQDRPEYLGGKRIPISMDQVANTAGPKSGESDQTLGSLGAYSNTGDSGHYFTKSFDTWGTITCVICVRTNESFSQGINRRYSRKSRLDFYWPQFANLGEQTILKKELYTKSTYDAKEQEVFGYQEAWAEYRFLPDIVSGHLRPDQDLGSYTYANLFSDFPTLAGYLDGEAIADNIDRTLTVSSSTAGFQFIGDFAFNIIATRPMPRYSIPGLVDHH